MATTEYFNAGLAIPINSTTPQKQAAPKRQKWPAIKKVLKSKGKPTEEPHNSYRLELYTPDFHSTLTPLYKCFSEAESVIKLLEDLARKDSELATNLEAENLNRSSHAHQQTLEEDREITFTAGGSTSDNVQINSYIDFLATFTGLFLRSRFLSDQKDISRDHDRHGVLSSLAEVQCPDDLSIFRRVFVNPHQIGLKFQEGETPELYNGIPVNHLAKFLDVVVVNFLSSVTENTSPAAVCWAIDYLLKLLRELYNSLSLIGSPGWYGALPIRSRKKTSTNRPSISRPPMLAPPLVVVGTPPTSPLRTNQSVSLILDPETGQHSPHPSPSSRGASPNLQSWSSLGSPQNERGGASPTFHRPHSPLSFSFNSTRILQDTEQHVSPARLQPLESSPPINLLGSPHRERVSGGELHTRLGRSFRSASPPALGSIREDFVQEDFSDSDPPRSPSPEEEVRSKIKSPADIPQVDKEQELRTGVTSEGRVSLIAILTAISNLPRSEVLWNNKTLGEKCFSLVQMCLDLGLPPKHHEAAQAKPTQTAQTRRQKFRSQDNPAFSKHGTEKPSVVHAKFVVEASVNALIQCATSLIVGCANEGLYCSLKYLRLPHQNLSSHNRLIRLLQRIDDHSPATFRKALATFSQPSNSTARKLFHFLHVILQYCSGSSDMMGSNSLMVDVVVGVLRSAVDRLVELDITEPSIQNSVVSEACSFFQYAHSILNEYSLSHISDTKHLEMYLHRIALSVILPPPPSRPDDHVIPAKLQGVASPLLAIRERRAGRTKQPNVNSPTELNKTEKSSTMPAKKGSLIQPAVQRTMKSLGERTRSGSLNISSGGAAASPKTKFKKQRSLHSDIGSSAHSETDSRRGTSERVGTDEGEIVSDWRGLKLDLLRGRIQRLVVLLNTSVPGTVPDPDMLASLIDLCDGKTVVSRAMVLLECAMFVSKLRTQDLPTVWVIHNKEHNTHLMHSVSHNLMNWAESISDKLRVVELREREIINRMRFADKSSNVEPVFEEEPVFPSDQSEDDSVAVSYAVKMAACQLLLEITRFLRDPPEQFCGWSVNRICTRLNSVVNDEMERKQSVSSVQSSDNESIPGGGFMSLPSSGFNQSHSPGSHSKRFGSNLSVEDAETLPRRNSIEESSGSTSPRKRVSVYLRVNSTSGTISRSSSLKRPSKVIRMIDSPVQVRASMSSAIHSRREVLTASTVNALHQSLYSGNTRSGRRPSVAGVMGSITVASHHPLPAKYRRQSVGATLFKQASLGEADRVTPSEVPVSSKTSATGHTLSTLRNRARKAMQTLRRRPTKSRHGSESGLSPNSSPNTHRRKQFHQRSTSHAGSFSHPGGAEERSLQCSWLRIIEHLIVVEHANSGEVKLQHNLACRQLISALKMVYSAKYEEKKPAEINVTGPTMSRSLSLMFTHRIQRFSDTGEGSTTGSIYSGSLTSENSRRRSQKSGVGTPKRVVSMPAALSKQTPTGSFSSINFSRINSLQFSSTLMGFGDEDENIALFLEAESTYPRAYLNAELDEQRREYLSSELLGMMHVPFSILVHAAPALHPSTLSCLKPLAWDALLDHDKELSQAAGAFFLLACLKETSSGVKSFVKEHVLKGDPQEQRGAVLRFKTLWETRYHVWPRMEERAQKKMCVNDSKKVDEEHKTIGYSLPATLLGQVTDTVPLAPWEFSAVCSNKTCAENPNLCYRSTQHITVIHSDEITAAVKDYSVSGVCLSQEASSKPANVFLGIGADDDIGNIEKWEAVKTTLFPNSLLPLIRFLISLLTSTSSQPTAPSQDAQLDMSELARGVVWQCMLEDEYLFFQPLLDQFNKLYIFIKEESSRSATDIEKILADILEPFHVLLQSFHTLPSRAAHFLFNNFVGVVMKHTDQPMVHSPRIIQSMLTLAEMVVPSVQGLDSKVLKNSLKKENCYTTVMTTARIRGVEKVCVTDLTDAGPVFYRVADGMTFANLIAEVCKKDRVSLDLLNNWYLVDAGRDVPVLSSLYIKDLYSAPLDGQCPTFLLKAASRSDKLWARQMDQLFVHKMSELLRVQFTTQLLHTGPDVEKGVAYSEYAQPNHQFIHNELVELNSFPRKVLTSVLQEAGRGALGHYPLHASDIMLKGTWVKFVLELFKSVKPDFNWSNNIVLFLNVVNGAMLLHGENHSILRLCLVSLLTAAAKFNSVFKRDGYQMIVPVLIQVYALHMQNTMITDALKFAWFHFYLLDENTFISQVAASSSTLFSETVASLSSKISSSHVPLPPAPPQMEAEQLHRLQVRAVSELFTSLEAVKCSDNLNILPFCQQCLDEVNYYRLTSDSGQRLSIENSAAILITLCTWNPEALRGMQVLVSMDHLSLQFLKLIPSRNSLSLIKSLEYLIRGCEPLARHHQFRKDNTSTRKKLGKGVLATDALTPGYPAGKTFSLDIDDLEPPKAKKSAARKVSLVIQQKFRTLVNPNQKGSGLQGNSSEVSEKVTARAKAPPPGASGAWSGVFGVDHGIITSQFKLRRLQHESQQILQLSRDSLLSIATQFVAHFAKIRISESSVRGLGGRKTSYIPELHPHTDRKKITFEPNSVAVLTFVAIQLLKQGYTNDRYEGVLQGRGLTGFMNCIIPNIEWSEPYFSSFQNLLNRLLKFFKYLQKESSKAMMVWDSLTGFITGLTHTIHNSPQLVQGQEQHVQKLKLLLETIVTLQHYSGGGNPQNQSASALKRYRSIQRIQTPLLQCASVSFCEAVVGLAVELIVLTHAMPQTRLRFHLSDLLYHKIIKEYEDLLLSKIVLPVCVQLGLRNDMDHPCVRDAEFVLEYINKNVEFVIKPNINPKIMNQKLPPEAFFRDLKVVCLAFSDTFSLQHWHKISQWVISLTYRKGLILPDPLKNVALGSEEGEGIRRSRLSSVSTTSSQTGPGNTAMLESFLLYHNCLLRFFETFLVVYQVPLLSLLSPLLRVQERQLQCALEEVKSDSPALFKDVNESIDRCQGLLSSGFNYMASVSRHQLLQKVNDNLRHLALPTRVQRSHTSVDPKPTRHKKDRRMSHTAFTQSPLPKIGEEDHDGEFLLQSSTLPKKLGSISPEHRPITLKWKGKSVSKSYVPPPISHSKHQGPLTESDTSIKKTSQRPQRKAHRPKMVSLSEHKRSPRLGLVGKSWSSGFNADIEDDEDTLSPEGGFRNATTNFVQDDENTIHNLASLSEDDSPTPSRRTVSHDPQAELNDSGKQTVLVNVEVHENMRTEDHVPVCALDSNESTSSATALVSPDQQAEDLSHTRSLPTAAHLNAKQGGRTRRVSFSNELKVSVPADGLSLALKESNKYMYHSLGGGDN